MSQLVLQTLFWVLILFIGVLILKRIFRKRSSEQNTDQNQDDITDQLTFSKNPYANTAAKLAIRDFTEAKPEKELPPISIALKAEIERMKNEAALAAAAPKGFWSNKRKAYSTVAMAFSLLAVVLISLMWKMPETSESNIHTLPQLAQSTSNSTTASTQLSRNTPEVEVDLVVNVDAEINQLQLEVDQTQHDLITNHSTDELATDEIAMGNVATDEIATSDVATGDINNIEATPPEISQSSAVQADTTQETVQNTKPTEEIDTTAETIANVDQPFQATPVSMQIKPASPTRTTAQFSTASVTGQTTRNTPATIQTTTEDALSNRNKLALAELEETKKGTIVQQLITYSTAFANDSLQLKRKTTEINAMSELFAATKSDFYKNQKKLLVRRKAQIKQSMQKQSQQYLQQLTRLCQYTDPYINTLSNQATPVERIALIGLKQHLSSCSQFETMSISQVEVLLHNNYKFLSRGLTKN